MTNVEANLLAVLRIISTKIEQGDHQDNGLCSWVSDEAEAYCSCFGAADAVEDLYYKLMEAWPENPGGSSCYPVPCDAETIRTYASSLWGKEVLDDVSPARLAEIAYDYIPYEYFYDQDNKYGAARLRMLDWMIAELEKKQ